MIPVFNVSAKEVDGDDYGDKSWRYYVEVKVRGEVIFADYYRNKPTLKEVIRQSKEALWH